MVVTTGTGSGGEGLGGPGMAEVSPVYLLYVTEAGRRFNGGRGIEVLAVFSKTKDTVDRVHRREIPICL
jgi:hypothetical protein